MRYVAQFAASDAFLHQLCVPELQAVVELVSYSFATSCTVTPVISETHGEFLPLAFVELLDDDMAFNVAKRCVLLRTVHRVMASGDTLKSMIDEAVGDSNCEALLQRKGSYCYAVEGIGAKVSGEDKDSIRSALGLALKHNGKVCLVAPSFKYVVWVMRGSQAKFLLTSLIAHSARQKLLEKYSLKTRLYIGTTSMPPELTFVMSNLGKVKEGSVVYDPFGGTGSSLYSAAHWGAWAIGSDVDGRTLRSGSQKFLSSALAGQQRDVAFNACGAFVDSLSAQEREAPSIATNAKLYGFAPPELLRLNFLEAPQLFRAVPFLDTIISDPPYGIREGAKRASDGDGDVVTQLVETLFHFAARSLVAGGRLVFWYPAAVNDETPLPTHPAFHLVVAILQPVSLKLIRQLVVFERQRLDVWSAGAVCNVDSKVSLHDKMFKVGEVSSAAYERYLAKRQRQRKSAEAFRCRTGAPLKRRFTSVTQQVANRTAKLQSVSKSNLRNSSHA